MTWTEPALRGPRQANTTLLNCEAKRLSKAVGSVFKFQIWSRVCQRSNSYAVIYFYSQVMLNKF